MAADHRHATSVRWFLGRHPAGAVNSERFRRILDYRIEASEVLGADADHLAVDGPIGGLVPAVNDP